MKVCTKCKVEKEFIEFGNDKNGKNGLFLQCKVCVKKYYLYNSKRLKENQKQYYLDNKEKISIYQKQYRLDNNKHLKQHKKQYQLDNKEYIREYQKQYHLNNTEYKKKYVKQYQLDNKEKRNKYQRDRIATDPLFKLRCNISTLIYVSIKGNGYTKKSKTHEILGCSFEYFKTHLENQFTEGMTWENQGMWHLDHIYPVSRATDEEHLIKLNHYTNFQPLWAIDNIKKSNKI